jgi:hypothetical protein
MAGSYCSAGDAGKVKDGALATAEVVA